MNKDQTSDFISYSETGYFSDFICRYINEDAQLNGLYHRFPRLSEFKFQIEEKENHYKQSHRNVLADVLSQQYNGYEISDITKDNIALLRDNNTFTITTGHQLNLFTGPLYFLYKIVSTINLVNQLKEHYPEYNFVPIYWMASEDHDFDEINFFNFKGKKIKWNSDQSGAVGFFKTDGIEEVFKVISAEFGQGKHAEELKTLFYGAYIEHSNLADATRFVANKLFGDYGLVIIDASAKQLKQIFVPFLEKELFHQVGFHEVSKTNRKLEDLGLKVQVNPREINLFYITEGKRERILLEENSFSLADMSKSWTKEELTQELHQFPERFSPNVIIRPLYQEVILPNLCYIGGGGELIYWLQLKSTFTAQDVVFPILLLRNSVLVKSRKQTDKLNRLGISDTDLFLKRNSFINKRVRKISNINIDFSDQINHLEEQFRALHELAKETDKSFLGAVNAQEIKQIKGLKHLEKRLLKAQKRKLKDEIERSTTLQQELFPNQSLQERTLNFSELYLEHGDQLIPALLHHLDPLKLKFTILGF